MEKNYFKLRLVTTTVITAIVAGLLIWLGISKSEDKDYYLGVAIILVLGFSFLLQVIDEDSAIRDIFSWGFDRGVRMPGVIFELSIDGVLFLLAYKLIIAPIIAFFIGLFFIFIGTMAALFVSIVTLPFYLVSEIKDLRSSKSLKVDRYGIEDAKRD